MTFMVKPEMTPSMNPISPKPGRQTAFRVLEMKAISKVEPELGILKNRPL